MKRMVTALALAGSIYLGISVPVSAINTPFRDVPLSHWALEYIQSAAKNGWISGDENQRFNPEQPVTGAELITMVTQMLYSDEIQTGSSEGMWYRPYQVVANQHHLLSNSELDLNSKMSAVLNRQEMAFILAQAMDDLNAQLDMDSTLGAQNKIPDFDAIPDAFQPSVKLVYQFGIITGVDYTGTFAGNQNMTRAQAAVVLCQLQKLFSNTNQPSVSQDQDKEDADQSDLQPEEQVTIGQVIVEPYFGGQRIQYVPSSGIWIGERDDGAYGFCVDSVVDIQAAFAQVMDRYPKSLTFFSTKELVFDPSDLCEPYELSHGLSPREKGTCYEYFDRVPVSQGHQYKSSAGEYYEYRINLYYGAAGIVRMYREGIIHKLPNQEDRLGSGEYADYGLLLNAVEEIEAQYGITQASSDYDKVYAIYQYVTSNIKYDYYKASLKGMDLINYLQPFPYPTEINFTLTYKKGVCFDYALLFKALCCAFSVDCYFADGYAAGDLHAWNIVEVDGAYYQVDATWDAGKRPEEYRYFLISDHTMELDHRLNTTDSLYHLPSCPSNY